MPDIKAKISVCVLILSSGVTGYLYTNKSTQRAHTSMTKAAHYPHITLILDLFK